MAKGNKSGAIIFFAILSIAALGLSGYVFVSDLISDDSDTLKLVALWDNLDENTDTAPYNLGNLFLVEYSNQMVLNTKYVTVHSTTRFSFAKVGLYKINLKAMFSSINVANEYYAFLYRNSSQFRHFYRWDDIDDYYYSVDSSLYINVTNSDTVYGIVGFSPGDDFGVSSSDQGNQLSIEYVVP